MKTSVILIILAVLVLLGSFFGYSAYRSNQENAFLAAALSSAIEEVKVFNEKISDLKKDEYRVGSAEAADHSKDVLSDLAAQIFSIKGEKADSVRDVIECSKSYIRGCSSYANDKINGKTTAGKANDLTKSFDQAKSLLKLHKTFGEGDTVGVINKIAGLIQQSNAAAKLATAKVQSGAVVTNAAYWSNPEYAGYHNEMLGIIADYNQGRKVLSRVITHYDNSVLTSQDNYDWSDELSRRRALLSRLDNMKYDIPPGTVYSEQHREVSRMLRKAISAMESFGGSQNSYTRSEIRHVSSENNAIMARLRAFYGIRR